MGKIIGTTRVPTNLVAIMDGTTTRVENAEGDRNTPSISRRAPGW